MHVDFTSPAARVSMSTMKSAHLATNARVSPNRRTVRIGVIGLGTVGTGTVKVLLEHGREVERRLGCRLELQDFGDGAVELLGEREVSNSEFPFLNLLRHGRRSLGGFRERLAAHLK